MQYACLLILRLHELSLLDDAKLLELYGTRRFTREIIQTSVDSSDFIHDLVGDAFHPSRRKFEDLQLDVSRKVWYISSHEIYCFHSSQGNKILVCPLISHDAHSFAINNRCQSLTNVPV